MTPIADMIEKMTADGVPIATILLAVRTIEQVTESRQSADSPVDKVTENRRAYDRERMAKKRMSGGQSADSPPTSQTASYLTSSSNTQKVEKEEERKKKAKRKVGIGLPPTWGPSEVHYAEGAEKHKSREWVDAKAEEMRLWARSNEHRAVARKSDWNATFTGWMRRDYGGLNGQRQVAADRSVVAGADRILERMRSFDRPLDPARNSS